MIDLPPAGRAAPDDAGASAQPGGGERRPGRPRDARADSAIIEAAVDVLADRGPSGFTVDEVASRAGCGKATVYRRWPTRAALLLDTAGRMGLQPPVVDTGSLRGDLAVVLSALGRKLSTTPAGRILPGVMAEATVDPDMRELLGDFMASRRAYPRTVVQRGVDRGELPADTDVEMVLDVVGGTIMFRQFALGKAADPAYALVLVDRMLAAFGATPEAREVPVDLAEVEAAIS
jgi:AcrR family transcriptional regulator